jgi:hypothetical protein
MRMLTGALYPQRPWILALTLLAPVSSLQAQGNPWKGPRYGARDVHVRIEIDRGSYRAHDSIRVRLTLQNRANHPVTYSAVTATGLVRLRVIDAEGREILPTVAPAQVWGSSIATLEPNAERLLKSLRGREWINLRDWGYDLKEPGKYAVVGIPAVAGPRLSADHGAVRSNEVTFTIEP